MTDYIARGKATLCNVGCVGWNGVRWVMLLCWLDLQMLWSCGDGEKVWDSSFARRWVVQVTGKIFVVFKTPFHGQSKVDGGVCQFLCNHIPTTLPGKPARLTLPRLRCAQFIPASLQPAIRLCWKLRQLINRVYQWLVILPSWGALAFTVYILTWFQIAHKSHVIRVSYSLTCFDLILLDIHHKAK